MDECPAPRRPVDGRPTYLAGIAVVVSLALFVGALEFAEKITDTRSARRTLLVVATIPLAISIGTLRQLVARQWKARRERRDDEIAPHP